MTKKSKGPTVFNVGDKIVYPMHGVGIVKAIEKKTILNKKNEYYSIVIRNNGMKVMFPVDSVDEIGVRSIINKKELKKITEILQRNDIVQEDDWKLRYQQNIEKVKSGSIFVVAEVARDLYKRGRIKELSIMERKLYENAYQLIMHEIALVRDMDIEEAGNYLSEILSAGQEE